MEKPVRKPRVSVIGLSKGRDAQMIEKEFGEKLELNVESSDCRSARLQKVAKISDVIVLMTKWISHNSQETLKEYLSEGVTLRYVHGGISSLRQEIAAL